MPRLARQSLFVVILVVILVVIFVVIFVFVREVVLKYALPALNRQFLLQLSLFDGIVAVKYVDRNLTGNSSCNLACLTE